MERVLIVSDTHGDIRDVIRLTENIMGVTKIIHLGDMVQDAKRLMEAFPELEVIYVRGNNDFSLDASERIFEAGEKKILLCHGHGYGISSSLTGLSERAKELGAEIVLYGHTHIAADEVSGGIRCFCPGSPSRPRGGNRSIGILEYDENYFGLAHYSF